MTATPAAERRWVWEEADGWIAVADETLAFMQWTLVALLLDRVRLRVAEQVHADDQPGVLEDRQVWRWRRRAT